MKTITYSAWTKNKEDLMNCSSGGMFYEFAKKMVADGGKVVGVVMDGLKAKYSISNDLEEIKKMRGSKYIPSNPAEVIKKIKKSGEKKILFVGLPCHIEAAKKMLDTSEMVLVDLKCHGLPKPGVFEEHVKKIAKGRKVKSVSFRNKKEGWDNKILTENGKATAGHMLNIEFENGDKYKNHKDSFLINYLNMGGKNIQEHCKTCKKFNVGDITIGDFWNVPPKLKNELGTSEVHINTLHGKDFFKSINTINKHKVKFWQWFNKHSVFYSFKKFICELLLKMGLLDKIREVVK